ncbi:hypothetical protein PHMEG_0005834 [Phytophthora megakarya]|uniref:Chromo domain-containing protein n=1 Tax=Phytophthora megakarya TaxID=4795 RepID=A0A225WSA0_9STRA|nr:hypothetical protein PHMEG_0005834 [Phytophthora megakarya]
MDGIRGRYSKRLFPWDRYAAAIAIHEGGGSTYRDSIAGPGQWSIRVCETRSNLGRTNITETLGHTGLKRAPRKATRTSSNTCSTGHFCVIALIDNHATGGSGYRIFPIVHLSKSKPVWTFPDLPKVVLNTEGGERVDFEEGLFPDDSWDTPEDEFEVEWIADMRSGTRTCYGRVHREFQFYWKDYDQPTWVDEADLNCAALFYEYERGRTSHNSFNVMQLHEEGTNTSTG